MLAPVLVTPPAVELISIDEAKAQLNVDHADDDALIKAIIEAAVSYLDGWSGVMGRALAAQTWKVEACGFSTCMRLPLGNLISVTSVKYYDQAGLQQTLAPTVYAAHSDALGPFITLKDGQSWPSTATRADAIEITWAAGYGAAAENVPAAIRQAMLLLVAHWYANREAVVIGDAASPLPFAVDALLKPFRRVGI